MAEYVLNSRLFKERLTIYISINQECRRNRDFWINYKNTTGLKLPNNFILYESRHKYISRIHYWWLIDDFIFDPTIHQFGIKFDGSSGDQYFRNIMSNNEKNAFDTIINSYKNHPIYDESIWPKDINDILRNWYFSNNFISNIFDI